MKKILSLILFGALSFTHPASAGEPDGPSAISQPLNAKTLDQQAHDMAAALQAKDPHALHIIDHVVSDENAAFQKNATGLSADQKQKLGVLLSDMATQATRAHHDGHHDQWDDAMAAQKQFANDVKQAETLLPPSK